MVHRKINNKRKHIFELINRRKSIVSYIAAAVFLSTLNNRHMHYHVHEDINWMEHVSHLHRGSDLLFRRTYRMKYSSFQKLLNIIRP